MRALLIVLSLVVACEQICQGESPAVDWQLKTHFATPKTYPAPDFGAKDLKAIFYKGPDWQGKPTRVFAYYGLPKGASRENPAPGVVCVHGGGGTAFAEWVRIWNRRGYAAIAMDTNGAVPQSPEEAPDEFRHEWAGPPRYGFLQSADAPQDHWNYHAVAAVIRANSFLGSLPEVDAGKVGITGISWGGYKTCIAIGLDDRFRFAIPVYGCGFLHVSSSWLTSIDQYGVASWVTRWDPSSYLGQAELPTLWINGTNDKHYHLSSYQKSYQLCPNPTLCLPLRMDHGHGSGWQRKEIYAFADSVVGSGAPLTTIKSTGDENGRAWVQYEPAPQSPVVSSELLYTTDQGPWLERFWQTSVATVDQSGRRVAATLPSGTTVYYFQLTDSRGLVVSSPHTVAAIGNVDTNQATKRQGNR